MPDIERLLCPSSIAIVGASDDVKTVRGRMLHVIRERGYDGVLHVVSRKTPVIQGIATVGSLSEIGAPVDLAILVTPAEVVPQLVDECGRIGIPSVLVVASGFAEEKGEAGKRLQEQLEQTAKKYDIAVCGPNTTGFLNAERSLAATFSPALENPAYSINPTVRRSRAIGVTSQSGGFTFAFLTRAQGRQVRFSFMVSTGNEAVLQGGDFVDFMFDDGETGVALMYMEGLRDADGFLATAARAADMGKPIVLAKTGRSEAGRRAAASHTGALAGESRAFDAVMREYGVLHGSDIDQMLDAALVLSYCKPATGNSVGLISSSGGGAVWMTETLVQHGLAIEPFDDGTRDTIAALLPSYGSAQNPIDLTATAIRDVGFARIIDIVDQCQSVDLIVVVGSLAYEYGIERDHAALVSVMERVGKPVVFCSYTTASPRAVELLAQAGIPVFTSMPNCARAMASLVEYGRFQARWSRDRALRQVPRQPAGTDRVREALVATGPVLCEAEAKQVLAMHGLDAGGEQNTVGRDEAVAAAGRIGYPVALKLQSPRLMHKTEAGALRLGIAGEAELVAAWDELDAIARTLAPQDRRGILVQRMAPAGIEVIVGVSRDPAFGPMVVVGLGGILVELLDDVVLAPVPVSEARALEMVESLRGAKIFTGLRGRPPADTAALARLIASISTFADAHRDVVDEIDLNPVLVHREGLSVVDALITLRQT